MKESPAAEPEVTSKLLTDSGVRWVQVYRAPLLIVSWLFFRTYALWGLDPNSDVTAYYEIGSRVVAGLAPYGESVLAFPPGALSLITLPRLFVSTLGGYSYAFAGMLLLVDLVILTLLWKISRTLHGSPVREQGAAHYEATVVSVAYIVLTGAFGRLLFQRYDLIVGALLLGVVYACLRRWQRPWTDLLLAVAVWVNPYTVALVPLSWTHECARHPASSRWAWRSLLRTLSPRILAFSAFVALLCLPWHVPIGNIVFEFFAGHAVHGGLQVESGTASALLLLRQFFSFELATDHTYGAHRLSGLLANQGAQACALMAPLAAAAVTLRFCSWLRRQSERGSQNLVLIRGVLAVTMTIVVTGSVFSPQFLLWTAPVTALLMSGQRHASTHLGVRALVVNVLTMLLLRRYYSELLELQTLPTLLLVARNVMVVWLVASLAVDSTTSMNSTLHASAPGWMSEPLGRALRSLPLAALIAWVATSSFFETVTNDLWLQLRVAKDILTTGELPRIDVYSAVAQGRPFIAHEWLSSLSFYGLAAMAPETLTLLRVVLAVGTASLLWWSVSQSARRSAFCVPLLGLACYLYLYRAFVRPHLFSLFFVTVWVFVLERWRRSRRFEILLVLPAVQVLWANFHGGHLFAVVLGATATFTAALSAWLEPKTQEERFTLRQSAQLGAVTVATLLAGLVNPYGWKLLRFSAEMAFGNDYIRRHILEWKSPFDDPDHVAIELSWLMCIVVGGALLARWRRWPLMDIGMAALAAWMTASAVRFVPYIGLLGFPIAVRHLHAIGQHAAVRSGRVISLEVAAFVLLWVSSLSYGYPPGREFGWGFGGDMPYREVQVVKRQGLTGAMFTEYADGALVIYVLHPRVRPVIDSRIDIYGETLSEEYFASRTRWPLFVAYLKENAVTIALLKKGKSSMLISGLRRAAWAQEVLDTNRRVLFSIDTASVDIRSEEDI